MLSSDLLEQIQKRMAEVFAQSPARDLEANLKAMLTSFFTRLDLVTREEFDVQREVLLRTREKLEQLEQRLARMEADPARAAAQPPSPEGVQGA
jgi:ubiquinone biosynthesis accessory factor UbiK